MTLDWRTASYSGNGGGNCVEAASGSGTVLVRDTTNRDGGTLSVPAGAWQAFVNTIK